MVNYHWSLLPCFVRYDLPDNSWYLVKHMSSNFGVYTNVLWYIINHYQCWKWVRQAPCYGLQSPIEAMPSHNETCCIQMTQMPMQLSASSLKEKWTMFEWLQHHREFHNRKWEQVNELLGHQYPGNSKWGGCIWVSHEGYHSRSVWWVVFFDGHEDLNLQQLHTEGLQSVNVWLRALGKDQRLTLTKEASWYFFHWLWAHTVHALSPPPAMCDFPHHGMTSGSHLIISWKRLWYTFVKYIAILHWSDASGI